MKPEDRFHDNPNGVINDTKNQLQWLPKDSWQDLGKWVDWEGALAYVKIMNQYYAGGFTGWRLPTKEEALSLYDENLSQPDWAGETIHIHPAFVRKAGYCLWVNDVDEEGRAMWLNLRDGSMEYVDKSTKEHHATRLVRTNR